MATNNVKLKHKTAAVYDRRAGTGLPDMTGMVQRKGTTAVSNFFGDDQVQAIAYRVSDMYAKGLNDHEVIDFIRDEYGFEWTMQKLGIMKKMLRAYWRTQTAEQMEDQVAEEVNACNVQLRELWKAYEFSKKGVQKETIRETHSSGESEENTFDQDETITVKETTAGDTKIMAQIIEVSKEKRKLLGLYAPEKKKDPALGTGASIQIAVIGANGEQVQSALGSLLDNAGQKKEDAPSTEVQEVEEVQEAETVEEAE